MRKFVTLTCVIGAVGLLAACGGAKEVSSTRPTVSYRVTGNDLAQASNQAATYCQPYASVARLTSFANGVATYECAAVAVQQTSPGVVVVPAR